MIRVFISFWVLSFLIVVSIPSLNGQTNAAQELTYELYINNVKQYHPLAQIADLKLEEASAEMMHAKGFLDPQLSADWDEKNLKDIQYYQQYRAMFRVPTVLGVDIVGGYENADGDFLNPEASISDRGLWNIGIEANVLQGLIVNERRTAIDQAKEYQNLAQNEREIMINELLFDASLAYLDWQYYHYADQIYLENITVAKEYFEGTKESYVNGEKTGMDTLEAYIQLQDAQNEQLKNEAYLVKSRQSLQNYLWLQEVPLELQEGVIPEDYRNSLLAQNMLEEDFDLGAHPMILSSLSKLTISEIEQKLKREKLKPKLKLKYNPLLATSASSLAPKYSSADFKWGLDFSYPLFQRSERADVELGKIKIRETQLSLNNKRNELKNKIENGLVQQEVIAAQLNIMNVNVSNYEKLLAGERELFQLGESSVFLLNKRQEKYIDGQLKLIDTYVQQNAALMELLYLMNEL